MRTYTLERENSIVYANVASMRAIIAREPERGCWVERRMTVCTCDVTRERELEVISLSSPVHQIAPVRGAIFPPAGVHPTIWRKTTIPGTKRRG